MFKLFRVTNEYTNKFLGEFSTENECLAAMRTNTKRILPKLHHPESVYYMVDTIVNKRIDNLEIYDITAMDDWGKGAVYPNNKGWKYHHFNQDYSKNEYVDLQGNIITKN